MIGGAQAAWVVARKEIMEHVRSKRIFIIGGLFMATFLFAAVLGILLIEDVGSDPGEAIRFVLMFYFSVGFVGGFTFTSVLAIALSADTVSGEWKDRSLFLLLSKPVSREAMLTGKILGAFLSVAMVFIGATLIFLIVMTVALGFPSGQSWWRILAGAGIVLAGLLPFVGVGVLCSCLFRTPVTSFVVALALWFLVFPLIGNIGSFIELVQHGTMGQEPISQIFALLSPTTLMRTAADVWLGDRLLVGFEGSVLTKPWLALLVMGAHTAVYLAISFFVVKRRDYA